MELLERRQAKYPTSGGPPDNSGRNKESASSAVCSRRLAMRRFRAVSFESQRSTDEGPTFDPSHGLRHGHLRIGKRRELELQFSSRVLLAHDVVYLGMLSVGARLGFPT